MIKIMLMDIGDVLNVLPDWWFAVEALLTSLLAFYIFTRFMKYL